MRAARRKKFFGTGRKKRQIPDELFDKIYSIDTDELVENEAKKTESSDPSYHAFHLCEYCLRIFASFQSLFKKIPHI